ncbi:MAG: NAD(P)-dependent oxidoreductase [Oscillospiraceae bacterium]|nr:NAD(P)-dependent oxidoreductase [Oscillospiraceae bacterium]
MQNKIICLGGDKRFSYIRKSINEELNINEAELIILPFSPDETLLSQAFNNLRKDQIVLYGGNIPKEYRDLKNAICYSKSEDFLLKNANLTAEGVLSLLITEIDKSLIDTNVAITGFGRIGKSLFKMLTSLGCKPTAFSCKGNYLATGYERFKNLAKEFDCVVNTAPALVLDEEKLKCLKKDCLLIEVASAPYGIDFNAADKLELKTIVAGSLPGKISPESAAKIILEEIEKIAFKGE